MNRDKIAEALNGEQYPLRISDDIKVALDHTDIVVVYGASDDLMEFEGAIRDEVDCYDGGTAYLHKSGLLQNECDDSECPYFKLLMDDAPKIEALWCKEDGFSWTYKTDIPHSTFIVLEDDGKYCRGIVFNLSDVKNR